MKKQKWILPFVLIACFLGSTTACTQTPILSSSEQTSSSTADNTDIQDSTPQERPPESSNTPPSDSLDSEESETPPTPSEPTPPPKAQYIKCTGTSVNFRAGAGTGYAVIGNAEKGTMYAVTGKTGNWYKTYYRGKPAYISTSYAAVFALEKTDNKVEQVIEEGYKLLGVPYVYGAVRFHNGQGKRLSGFSAQKFDCSSLMQYVFYKGTGTLLGLHTRAQVKQGKYVKPNDLQRGDCMFFTNEQRQYNTGIERVGHVALYLGEGYILHTASDYARIEKISAKRWGFFLEARRFV